MNEKIKILYAIPSLSSCDGIASYAINYYRRVNHEEFQIDFLINAPDGEYIEEVQSYKDRVFIIKEPGVKNIKRFLCEVNEFFRENHGYDIIHSHVPNTATFYLACAKKYGIKNRILHSHVTKSSDIIIKKIRNDLMAPFAVRNATHYAACTRTAGNFLFGRKQFDIINNAIDLKKFEFTVGTRKVKREELHVEEKLVIGSIGRFCQQKNTLFLIDIFEEVVRTRQDAMLLLIGEGPIEAEVKAAVARKGLSQAVIFAGIQTDVAPFYQAMDVFVLPSRYEGLGIVFVESQVSGLPTFASKEVPEETAITTEINYVGLKEEAKVWANKIVRSTRENVRRSHVEEGRQGGFDIIERVDFLENYYKQIVST